MPDSHPAALSFPQAFEPGTYAIARMVAESPEFYKIFVRYVAAFMADVRQLVHFRAKVVGEVNRQAGKNVGIPLTQICWAAMSLVTDRYFAEKASMYGWTALLEEELRAGWYELITPAFVPSSTNRRLALAQLKEWRAKFLEAHNRRKGPLLTCEECTSKCFYQYEVSQSLDERNDIAEHSGAETIARVAVDFCKEVFAPDAISLDLAFCVALHLMQDGLTQGTPEAKNSLALMVRKVLDSSLSCESGQYGAHVRELTLQMIVEHALAGAPWRKICAEPMQANAITEEDVLTELRARTRDVPDGKER